MTFKKISTIFNYYGAKAYTDGGRITNRYPSLSLGDDRPLANSASSDTYIYFLNEENFEVLKGMKLYLQWKH